MKELESLKNKWAKIHDTRCWMARQRTFDRPEAFEIVKEIHRDLSHLTFLQESTEEQAEGIHTRNTDFIVDRKGMPEDWIEDLWNYCDSISYLEFRRRIEKCLPHQEKSVKIKEIIFNPKMYNDRECSCWYKFVKSNFKYCCDCWAKIKWLV